MAAFVRRGSTFGFSTVLFTFTDSLRLCPGTPSNVCSILSFARDSRGFPTGAWYRPPPEDAEDWRRSAALVVRGTIVGLWVVTGAGRALKDEEESDGRDELDGDTGSSLNTGELAKSALI